MPALARLIVMLVLGLPLALAGCKPIAALGILMSPRQWQKAEFELTTGRLAIVMDSARATEANPVFERTLHEGIAEYLRDNKVPSHVIPYDDVIRLRQAHADFASWSLQRIGRELDADQVLSVQIDRLRARPATNPPVVSPHVELRLKVVGVSDAGPRLWPDKNADPNGRTVTHDRQAREADTVDAIDTETTKLARETAYYVARYFYKYDTEENPPREP
jgi:hypothetical protein